MKSGPILTTAIDFRCIFQLNNLMLRLSLYLENKNLKMKTSYELKVINAK